MSRGLTYRFQTFLYRYILLVPSQKMGFIELLFLELFIVHRLIDMVKGCIGPLVPPTHIRIASLKYYHFCITQR